MNCYNEERHFWSVTDGKRECHPRLLESRGNTLPDGTDTVSLEQWKTHYTMTTGFSHHKLVPLTATEESWKLPY